ncbi:hypothetical protein [Spiroplasma culicicola]|uniref:Uncharacterized protein n=1 Tax=Spiroplasma culicicola AES-1 TaxID=1276246 RepID=W6A7H8_9MOLU|nr:hypothetical protein [Spiroplasma culicicola]AHI52800.1 hypothetical protein SCULI_v1c04590 [Spiroplasma culicicola AES-1]
MAIKRFEKSPLYVEIMSNGQVVYEPYYNYLLDVFEKEPENRKYFYDAKIADKATEEMLPRTKISVEQAHTVMNQLNALDWEKNLIEIGFLSNKEEN